MSVICPTDEKLPTDGQNKNPLAAFYPWVIFILISNESEFN